MIDTQKKKEKELFKKLNSLYTRDYERITDWLDDIGIEYSGVHNGKITNILTGVKIKINTDNEYGTYNSILKCFLHLWTFKMPILVFIIFVFSYLIFPNIFDLSIICPI